MSGGFSGKRGGAVSSWRSCLAPLSNCLARIEYPDTLLEYFEFQPGWIGLVSRDSVKVLPWYLSMQESHLSIVVNPAAAIQAFDYDSQYDLPATAYNNYKIRFGFEIDIDKAPDEEARFAPVYLREHLDSPIVDLEWGQPIFYEGR